jgi:hypothetical protein
MLTVNNNETLNFETNPGYSLIIQVQDNGPGNLIGQAIITVGLIDINEPPIVKDQSISLEENSPYNQEVGSVYASDPDMGQQLVYSIVSGNSNDAFAINANTGMITINNASVINYESHPEFGLTVQVQDNGPELLSSEALIAITLIDVNEVPIIENQTFSLLEMGNFTIQVGTVEADDPDFNQTLTYSMLPGINDTESVFEINADNGNITVVNIGELDHDTNPVYHLNIQVQDNGEGTLTNQALITINILDVNEPPTISDQEFIMNINLENDINSGDIYVGTVIAFEPDEEQSISFSIEDGNDRSIFSLLDNTGKLVVSDPSALYLFEYYNYSLQIKVEDDSPQHLHATATVHIHVYMESISSDEKSSEFLGNKDLEIDPFAMNVYPNPTSNYFEIDLKNLEPGKTTISVYSAAGEITIQETFISENGNLLRKFDIEQFRSGLYFIQVSNNSSIYNSKIVKE